MRGRILAQLIASLLAACGAAAPSTGPERSTTAVTETPATVEETTTPEEPEECRREWPSDPSDPRVGFYVFERVLYDGWDAENSFYRFDGATLSSVWFGTTNLPLDCTYGRVDDIPAVSVQTFHAHVTHDGFLFALVPCFGWLRIGHFLEEGRLRDHHFAILRRVAVDDRDAIYAAPMARYRVDLFFECREPYEAPDVPIPPRPE